MELGKVGNAEKDRNDVDAEVDGLLHLLSHQATEGLEQRIVLQELLKVLCLAEELANHSCGTDLLSHVLLVQILNVTVQVLHVSWLVLLLLGLEYLRGLHLLTRPQLC